MIESVVPIATCCSHWFLCSDYPAPLPGFSLGSHRVDKFELRVAENYVSLKEI